MKRHSTFYFIPLICISLAPLAAQRTGVDGVVLDPSGYRVRGAEVRCDSATVTTGLDGAFRFANASKCQLRVVASGFQTATVDAASGASTTVRLEVQGVAERIVVSASRGEVSAEQAGVAANVVNRAELATKRFYQLSDYLREMPGTSVAQSGRPGSVTSIFTRGAASNHTLVLVDGMPVNDPGGTINLGNWNVDGVERIEAVRAPQSILFGAEASAGVVQMFSARGDAEHKMPHGEITYERGSFGTDHWQGTLSGGSGARFDYLFNAAQIHTANEFANDYFRNTSGGVNLGYRISNATSLRGTFRSFDTALGVPGQVRYGLVDTDANETNRDSLVSVRLDDARGARFIQSAYFGYHRSRDVYTDLRMNGPFNVALLVRTVPGSVPRTYREAVLDPLHLPAAIPAGYSILKSEQWLWPSDAAYVTLNSRKRAEYQGTYAHQGGALSFGYNFEQQSGNISALEVNRNRHGFYALEQYSFGRRVFLSGGIRAEHSSTFGTKTAPRGAASFLLFGEKGAHSSTMLRFSAGHGITEPSLIQNFAREAWYQGNAKLKPERTNSFEAGLVQEWFSRRVRTEVSAFWSTFHDLIVFVSLPPPVWGSWDNVDSSWAKGVEFSTRVRLMRNVTFNAAYTHMATRIVNSNSPLSPTLGIGQELMRRPGNSGSMFVSVTPRRWWLVAGSSMVGERQDTDFLGVTRNPGYQNVYVSTGLRAYRHVTPFLRCDNLLNSRYEEVLGYSSLSRSVRGGIKLAW